MTLRICIDVDDVERAITFYTTALGLVVGRRFDATFVELLGAPVPIDLLGVEPGSTATKTSTATRHFDRHWTPVHLDFVVDDLDATVRRITSAGGTLEGDVRDAPYGRLANCADPFGHGLCLLEMNARGYDALLPT